MPIGDAPTLTVRCGARRFAASKMLIDEPGHRQQPLAVGRVVRLVSRVRRVRERDAVEHGIGRRVDDGDLGPRKVHRDDAFAVRRRRDALRAARHRHGADLLARGEIEHA